MLITHRFRVASLLANLLLLTLLLAGCGRSGLGGRCAVDDDCRGGFFCVDGVCEDEPGNNVTPNNVSQCEDDDDCEAGEICDEGSCTDGPTNSNAGECYENDEGVCVQDVDGEPEVCLLGCPPNTTQVGCECIDLTCQDSSECEGELVCIDGVCDNCKEDDNCPEGLVCAEGACVDENLCTDDSECLPSERCAADGVCRNRPTCVFDDDCGAGEICFNGTCTVAQECQVDLDCPEGQECVGGNCFIELCRGPEDCPDGEICDAGQCVEPPTVVDCEVVTPDQIITEGQRVPLEGFAFDQNGVAVAATFEWTSSAPDVARAVPGPAALGGTTAGTASFTAVITGMRTACSGEAILTNPGVSMPDTIRVVVTDLESGAPIEGATVEIGADSATTDATGVAALPDSAGDFSVTVSHQNFNWLTVHGVSARDLRLPLRRQSGTGDVAGFTGEFDTSMLHSSGNITLGLAGASLAGGLLELDLAGLLGDTFVSRLEIPGVVEEDIPLPGGLVAYGGALGFMVDLKTTYYAQTSGGPRIAWGLAGLLPFSELLSFFQGGDFEGGEILAQLLPLFNRFDHGAHPNVFAEAPRIVDTADIDRDGDTTELLPDYNSFPVIDLQPSVRQNLVTDVGISNFPLLNGQSTELAILVGGVVLPSPGFIPTGISATSDDDGDGRPDLRRLSIAPGYGPLVGGRYAIVAITFGSSGGGIGPGGFELPDEFSVALWNGQNYPTSLSLGTFPDGSTASVDEPARQVSVNSSAGPMFRVRMVGEDRTWDVWSVGPPGVMGSYGDLVDIPTAPGGGADVFTTGQIYVDAIQTNTNLDDLVSSSGIGLKNAGLVSSAYNRTRVR